MPIPARTPSARPTPRVLLRDLAHQRILGAIIDGTFTPGEKLNDNDLAAWLGVSRTPVREALAELGRQGLVEASPGKQTVVTPIDPVVVSEAARIVAALHAFACEEAADHLSPEIIQKLTNANASFALALDTEDPNIALTADDAFHNILVNASGNSLLAQTLETLMPYLRRAEHAHFSSTAARASIEGHAAIIRALADGDAAAAARASRENWLTLHARIGSPRVSMTQRDD